MNRRWSLVGAACVISVAGCHAAAPLAPSPSSAPQVIRGTVRETRPFPHIRVAGATVQAGGAITQADEFGLFSLTTAGPCRSIAAWAPGYERSEVPLPDGRAELVDLELMPLPGEAEEHRSGTSGTLLDVGSQRGGSATVTLEWSTPDTDFDLILWKGNRPVAYSTQTGGTIEKIHADLEAGVLYELAVFHYAGPDTRWTVTIHRPR